MATYESYESRPLYRFVISIGAAIALAHYVTTTVLEFLDVVLFEPWRILFRPEASIELELNRLRHDALESVRLERDKSMHEFELRGREHPRYIRGGFYAEARRHAAYAS